MAIHKVGGQMRAYGAGTIKRIIQSQKPDHSAGAETSIADKPHSNNREQQRRLRQAAKRNGN
jgi:hypothetical protein